jgi:hypothetical protein
MESADFSRADELAETLGDQRVAACLPVDLHPMSQKFLEAWILGDMPTREFLRWFHMPNSDYLPVAQCLLRAVFGA